MEKRYETICAVCKYKFYAAKSLGHMMGILHAGHGICPACGTSLNLTFNKDEDKMETMEFSEFLSSNNTRQD